jgi:uncharacterized phage-associated protein
MSLLAFKPLKTIQAAAVLLKVVPDRRMSRLRLLKLLYISNREALKEKGRLVAGDRMVAMKNGPVMSATYDLIKGADYAAPLWNKYFKSTGKWDVELIADPEVGKLSKYEIEKLQEVASRFENYDDWAVADYTHQFTEWQRNQPQGNAVKEIPLDDLLEAVGLKDEKEDLLREAHGIRAVHQMFARART